MKISHYATSIYHEYAIECMGLDNVLYNFNLFHLFINLNLHNLLLVASSSKLNNFEFRTNHKSLSTKKYSSTKIGRILDLSKMYIVRIIFQYD
jgi:hypothetical protein